MLWANTPGVRTHNPTGHGFEPHLYGLTLESDLDVGSDDHSLFMRGGERQVWLVRVLVMTTLWLALPVMVQGLWWMRW